MTMQSKDRLQIGTRQLRCMSQALDLYLDLIEPPDAERWPPFRRRKTTLMRNYLGSWVLLDQQLYLVGIDAEYLDGTAVTLDSLFPGYPERVFAHWFSGPLYCFEGDIIGLHNKYEHMYEKEFILTLCRGKVTATETINTAELVRQGEPSATHKNGVGRLLNGRG